MNSLKAKGEGEDTMRERDYRIKNINYSVSGLVSSFAFDTL